MLITHLRFLDPARNPPTLVLKHSVLSGNRVPLFLKHQILFGWWFQLFWKIWVRQLRWLFPHIMESNPNVPNHQPGYYLFSTTWVFLKKRATLGFHIHWMTYGFLHVEKPIWNKIPIQILTRLGAKNIFILFILASANQRWQWNISNYRPV